MESLVLTGGSDTTALLRIECLVLTVGENGVDILFGRPVQRDAINDTMARETSAILDRFEESQSVGLVALRVASRPTDIAVLTHGVQPGTPETRLLAMPVRVAASMPSYAGRRVGS